MRPVWLLALLVGCNSAGIAHGPRTLYQVTNERVPTMPPEALELGLDVNGDATVDNQLGNAFTFMAYYHLGDPQAGTEQALANGPLALTLEIERDTDDPDLVNATAYVQAIDVIDAPATIDDPLVGTRDGDYIDVRGNALPLVIAPFGIPLTLPLQDAHVAAFVDGLEVHGIIAGAIDPAVLQQALIPQWRDVLEMAIERDCTRAPQVGCGCTPNSEGAAAVYYVTPDCTPTVDEIVHSPFVEGSIGGDIQTTGKPALLSVGVSVDATIARPL